MLRALEALIAIQRVSLTAIGRAVRGRLQPRHGIKMMDRLLGNPRLQAERHVWFKALARRLVGDEVRVLILLDWTQLHGEFWALVAAVPFEGRSVPILAEAHHESRLGSRDIQNEFISTLRRILPERCRPVIVADGGFRSPFFAACRRLGIDYVIRLRNDRATARIGNAPRGVDGWSVPLYFKEIFEWARRTSRCLGLSLPFRSSAEAVLCRLVLGPAPAKMEKRSRYAKDYERKRACEPWLLATTLDNEPAEKIVAIYATRMQVEECFRDTKNARLGWGLEFAKTRSPGRLNVLLLLVAIAFAAVILVGATAASVGLEKKFRASSRKQRVLSHFSLGNLVVRSLLLASLRLSRVWKHIERIRRVSRRLFPPIRALGTEGESVFRRLHHDEFCADCGWHCRAYG